MELVFIDESGSLYPSHQHFQDNYQKKASNSSPGHFPPYPFFILAAVGLPESKYSTVDEWFHAIKARFLGAGPRDTGPQFEIKGSLLYALRQGKEPYEWQGKGRKRAYTDEQKTIWSKLKPKQLESLELAIFDLLQRISPVIWVIVVKQAHVYTRYKDKAWPPHHSALTYLQQRVAHFLQANYGAYQHGLLIMDQTSTLYSAAHWDQFFVTRDLINGTVSWPVSFRRYLVDVPVSGASHLVQGIQLPDIVAHSVSRMVHKQDTLGWFTRIEPFLAKHWRTGLYENAGLTYIQ